MKQPHSQPRPGILGCVTLLLVLVADAGCRPSAPGSTARLAVANSYVEAAVTDLLGHPVAVVRLAEPGTCPGQFDLRPSQVAELKQCQLLLRFGLQQGLDAQLERLGSERPVICPVDVKGGLCQGQTYLSICQQTAETLVKAGWMDQTGAKARLQDIASRVAKLEARVREEVNQAGLKGLPVLVAQRQQAFCESLGLQVVASFPGADLSRISEINQVVTAGKAAKVKLVIANLPEGRQAADALAERLEAPVVVLGNFPVGSGPGPAFDRLVTANVALLRQAAKP